MIFPPRYLILFILILLTEMIVRYERFFFQHHLTTFPFSQLLISSSHCVLLFQFLTLFLVWIHFINMVTFSARSSPLPLTMSTSRGLTSTSSGDPQLLYNILWKLLFLSNQWYNNIRLTIWMDVSFPRLLVKCLFCQYSKVPPLLWRGQGGRS